MNKIKRLFAELHDHPDAAVSIYGCLFGMAAAVILAIALT